MPSSKPSRRPGEQTIVRTEVLMGTLVTIDVLRPDAGAAVDRAFAWFREIEARCTRFDDRSELAQLSVHVGRAVPASTLLFEAVRFALAVAEESAGAFDPTVGGRMAARGFNREHRTGQVIHTGRADGDVSYRDVELDAGQRTITLHRPLTLDLGAVAKGLAIDMAVEELRPFEDFAIDAGGDLYLGGHNPHGMAWSIGIRHPRADRQLIESLRVSDRAVCTSGDYERPAPDPGGGHHILDPRTGESPSGVASVTVVAPTAMAADALATAAFASGPVDGLRLLERHGVEGLIVTPALERFQTPGLPRA
jgi:thiamine biosynthesis lipoprotein